MRSTRASCGWPMPGDIFRELKVHGPSFFSRFLTPEQVEQKIGRGPEEEKDTDQQGEERCFERPLHRRDNDPNGNRHQTKIHQISGLKPHPAPLSHPPFLLIEVKENKGDRDEEDDDHFGPIQPVGPIPGDGDIEIVFGQTAQDKSQDEGGRGQ